MGYPTIEFNGTVGQKSIGVGGPDQIEADLHDIAKMFDPTTTLLSGQAGGLTEANHQTGTHDTRYYTKTLSDATFATRSEIHGIVLGQIPDGTIAPEKLSFNPLVVTPTATGIGTAIDVSQYGFSLTQGMKVEFIASASNSAAATTLNVNSTGAKNLYKPGGTDAPSITAGKLYSAWYDSTGGCFFIKASAEGSAVAGDVLAGVTFSNDVNVGISGTLALTGTAAVGDIISGKTFYNTDAKTKLTGTGANAKRFASGTATTNGGGYAFVSGLSFTPSTVKMSVTAGTQSFYKMLGNGIDNLKIEYSEGWRLSNDASYGFYSYITSDGFVAFLSFIGQTAIWTAYE